MRNYILVVCVLFLLTVDLGSDARRHKNRLHRLKENEQERDYRRDREEEEQRSDTRYKTIQDDAIIIKVPRKHRQRNEFDTAASNVTNYQLWPGDFNIHQIHYPTHFPIFPQQQQPRYPLPQYPWTIPQVQQPLYPTHPPQIQIQQPQYPTHPPRIEPNYPTHAPQPPPMYPTHPPPQQPPPSGGGDAAVVQPPQQSPPKRDKPASCGKSYVQSVDNTRIISGAPAAYGATASDLSDLQVVLGDHNLYQEGEPNVVKRPVEKLISHAHLNKRSNFNDIALLKLASPVPFSQNIQPICLARSSKSYAPGKQATVAGWGRTSPVDGTRLVPQQTPLKITVPVVEQSSCQRSFFRVAISEHMVCAGEGSKSACLGDSGGPLMVRSEGGGQGWEQIGIVSWGYNCVGLTVYTRVNEFQDWIEKHRNS